MIIKFFVFFMFLVGCGYAEPEVTEKRIDVPFYIDSEKVDLEVLPYVMEFAGHCEKFNAVGCKENFKKIEKIEVVSSFEERFVVGKCFMNRFGNRKIQISNELMDLDSFSMQTVVMHEMAHCVLGSGVSLLPHYDEEPDIMNTYLLPEKIIFSSWPTLIETLFARAATELSLTEMQNSGIVTSTVINQVGGFDCETRKN